jgi:hypothetical protein
MAPLCPECETMIWLSSITETEDTVTCDSCGTDLRVVAIAGGISGDGVLAFAPPINREEGNCISGKPTLSRNRTRNR